MRCLGLLPILILLIGLLDAVDSPGSSNSLVSPSLAEPLYTIQRGALETGGCDDYLGLIKDMYTEAIYMLKAGDAAFTNLLYPVTRSLITDFQGRAVLFHFGLRWNPEAGNGKGSLVSLVGDDRSGTPAGLRVAQSVFTKILQFADTTNIPDKTSAPFNYKFVCGNKGVVYVKPTDKDPQLRAQFGTDINNPDWTELNHNNEYPDGALWHEFSQGIHKIEPGRSTDVNSYICTVNPVTGGADGMVTKTPWGTIFFCPPSLDPNWAPPSGEEYAREEIKKGDYGDTVWRTAPKTLAHELTHLYSPLVADLPAVDVNTPPSLSGSRSPLSNTAGAYGFNQVIALAFNYPERAPYNADTLASWAYINWLYDFAGEDYGWDFTSYAAQPVGDWPGAEALESPPGA